MISPRRSSAGAKAGGVAVGALAKDNGKQKTEHFVSYN
jgi:hypothetical protein